ncbi:transcription factor SPEECHLESS-like isoform X2 [Andrographis paniculata]|uniref:transcription factor SPEECHLESS-like isoform X2 n=1 Tax=Andrographis paniculata TaxID=175694 RepID=UPI0021E958D9|nr:transcription factor SPEECHLESS-like isoform X2 [Andrographis paniculata]
MDGEDFSDFLEESTNFAADDIFSILEAFENSCNNNNSSTVNGLGESVADGSTGFEFHSPLHNQESLETNNSPKRQKLMMINLNNSEEGLLQVQKISHITVERNRRKQMNEHLAVLRALMPCFYVKRGDQASIIGGVVSYITELQQILQSLESKKQRKSYAEAAAVLSPRLSPRPSPAGFSPRRPPLSPGGACRLSGQLPISPRTPQPSSPYKPRLHSSYLNSSPAAAAAAPPSLPSPVDLSPCSNSSTSSINDSLNELVASSKSAMAEVEVKFSGPNLLLKTASHRLRGQAVKIVAALDELALETLQMNVSTIDETMLYSFTIKVGIDCQLSAEELAEQIQQTFC